MRHFPNASRLALLLAVVLTAAPLAFGLGGPDMGEGNLADVLDDGRTVTWRMIAPHSAVWLTVSTPCGVFHRVYQKGEEPSFSIEELEPDNPDGTYTWQIRVEPQIDPQIQEILNEARQNGDTETPKELWRKGLLPQGPFIQTGEFGVDRGVILPPETEKQGELRVAGASSTGLGAATAGLDRATAADIIHNDDVLILRSLCVGFDCVNGENFGADTIRLKENNLRIHALDTSVGSFPTTDWRLEFNSNLSGGPSYFRVIDATANRNIMTIEANAPSNSLVVDNGGRLGIRTANPVVDLHIADGDTPTLRLEQNTSSGFAAQTWDVAGNETSFFIRDATNGSTLPFRIRPTASSNSLVIDSDDDVGVGILSPTASLHVRRSNGTAQLLVEETSTTAATRTLISMQNNGGVRLAFNDMNITAAGGNLSMNPNNAVNVNGDLSVTGVKNFFMPDPEDATQSIYYAALEGPEAGTYYRGQAKLVDGVATIELPDYFSKVTEREQMSVQLTTIGGWGQLYVEQATPEKLVVRDAEERDGVEFYFLVQGVRAGYLDYQVKRPTLVQ